VSELTRELICEGGHSQWLDAMHLASASLPIGGFAYSQGLEQAYELGVVTDLDSAQRWIGDFMQLVIARQELPWWIAVWDASAAHDADAISSAALQLQALRETAELRLESRQMAHALLQVYRQWIDEPSVEGCLSQEVRAALGGDYSAAHAALCAWRGLSKEIGLTAWLWSWLDSQVLAAVKLVALGQRDGQCLAHALKPLIGSCVVSALKTPLSEAATAAYGLAIASARHETQYARLFRS
jgi:urease accessory protein